MKNNFRKFRIQALMTQSALAEAVGVTQPTYQRWESGKSSIPKAKLKKLAKILETQPDILLGNQPPIEAVLYDDSAPEAAQYYGEVAIHFKGGGEPLLLTISEEAFRFLYTHLQWDIPFVTIESMANETVLVRTKAIADLYFSSEAYDDFGPMHGSYKEESPIQLPDPRDWAIIECIEYEMGLEDFDPDHVRRVCSLLGLDEEIADGEAELSPHCRESLEQIFERAKDVRYQLSTGEVRKVYVDCNRALYKAFWELLDLDPHYVDQPAPILLNAEGRHRIVYLNPEALDYVSVPSHKLEDSRLEFYAESLDED